MGLSFCVLALAQPAAAQRPALVSMRRAGSTGGNFNSINATVSANGRFVTFSSFARNLVAINITPASNVYVRDLQTGVTTLVSMNHLGNDGGNGTSINPIISSDGRYVAFQSSADNLTPTDTNRNTDIFVRDLQTGVTTLASPNQARTDGGNGESINPFISANGQVVTFQSTATNLVANDTNNLSDVFAYDFRTGVLSLVSVNRTGTGSGNNASFRIENSSDFSIHHSLNALSDDGRFTVFESAATDLVAAQDNNGHLLDKEDVFVRDLQTGTTTLVSVNMTGDGTGNSYSFFATISGNGKFVAFISSSSNLAANKQFPDIRDVFVRNLEAGTTTLVSVSTSGGDGGYHSAMASISTDGRFVAFQSQAGNLVPVDTNGGQLLFSDIFVRDMQLGLTKLVSLNSAGTDSGSDVSHTPTISADGRFVAFTSSARNLVSNVIKPVNSPDIYVWDWQTGTTTMLSVTPDGTHSSMGFTLRGAISANGQIVAFDDTDPNLITGEPPSPFSTANVFAVAVNGQVRFSAHTQSVNEGDGTVTVTATRSGGNMGPLTIFYKAYDGTAASDRDFTSAAGTLAFADGEVSKTFTVPILDDGVDEADETINLLLSNFPGDAPTVLSTAVLTILDDDPAPTLSVNDVSVVEGNANTTNAVFTATLSAASEQDISVDVSAQAGTAAQGADFQSPPPKLTILAGRTSQTITVPVNGETVFEPDETFTLNLSNPVNVVLADGQGLGTIGNDDTLPAIAINNVTVAEGNSGPHTVTFTVSLSNASYQPVSVQYATTDGTATAGSDYTAANGTATFSPGALSASVTVLLNGDTAIELNETFFVNLTGPVNASIVDGQGLGTVVNDDGPAVRLSAAGYQINEGAGGAVITVTRSGDQASFSVDYRTFDNDTFTLGCSDTVNNRGAAYARCDFATVSGTIQFAAGETSKTINVPIIDDTFVEGGETFRLALFNAVGAALVAPTVATITILDNDTAPGAPNPVFSTPFFVRQHYLDFLSREPEQGEPWTNVLNNCSDVNNNPSCDRLTVSAAFFGSPEFQLKGFYVFRFYKVAFNRLPQYAEIVTDMSFVAGSTAQEVFNRKAQLAVSFTQRPEFETNFGALANADYVAQLMNRYQLTQVTTPVPAAPDGSQKVTLTSADLISKLDGAELTRAQVLRAIADSDEVGATEFNQAFVAMQYYGYLRRTPETGGYQAWLNYLNAHPGDFRTMVNGFMNSQEYRLRFGN